MLLLSSSWSSSLLLASWELEVQHLFLFSARSLSRAMSSLSSSYNYSCTSSWRRLFLRFKVTLFSFLVDARAMTPTLKQCSLDQSNVITEHWAVVATAAIRGWAAQRPELVFSRFMSLCLIAAQWVLMPSLDERDVITEQLLQHRGSWHGGCPEQPSSWAEAGDRRSEE